MHLKTFISALIPMLAPLFTTAQAWAQPTLTVGVRNDAAPFSYLATDGTGIYKGYVVDICRDVLGQLENSADFKIEYKAQEPLTRFEKLQNGEIDILCDPSTINIDRLNMPGIMVSQPIYLSGIGMAKANLHKEVAPHWPCIGPIVGIVKGTTSGSSAIGDMVADKRFGESFGERITDYLSPDDIAFTSGDLDQFKRCEEAAEIFGFEASRINPNPVPDPVIRSYDNHTELAQAVCDQTVMFSVGDLEIIATALKDAEKLDKDCDHPVVDPHVISEERYGIFVHVSKAMDDTDKLVVAFLRQLSIEIHKGRQSVLIQSFRDNFEAKKISGTLDRFFWHVIAGGE